MGDEEQRRVLEQVFGSSSDDDCDDEVPFRPPWLSPPIRASAISAFDLPYEPSDGPQDGGGRAWEKVEEVKGLWLCRDFLDPQQQSWLLSSIDREGWFPDASHNQAMKFGDLPEWTQILSSFIHDSCFSFISELDGVSHRDSLDACPLPLDILYREPLFDQLIANSYEPGEGICAHVDLMRFEDGIAIVSLRSTCVMHFTAVEQQGVKSLVERVPVLLTPGSLVLMSGDARYLWKHEINRKQGFQLWEGKEIVQQRRTSITLRKLCPQA